MLFLEDRGEPHHHWDFKFIVGDRRTDIIARSTSEHPDIVVYLFSMVAEINDDGIIFLKVMADICENLIVDSVRIP